MSLILIADDPVSTELPCKGVYYRYIESSFTGKGGRIVFSNELRPLKSISCPGCSQCLPEVDCLDELLNCIGQGAIEFSPQLSSGDTAILVLKIDSRDRESGHVDDYHYVAHKVDPPQKAAAPSSSKALTA